LLLLLSLSFIVHHGRPADAPYGGDSPDHPALETFYQEIDFTRGCLRKVSPKGFDHPHAG
jgi:hypothetical protein